MTRTGIHECRIGMPKQWSYRDSGKESTRIPIQSHENPDNIPISAPDFGSLKGSYRDSENTVAYTFVLKKVSSLVEDSSPTQRIVIAGILLVLIRDAKSSGSPS